MRRILLLFLSVMVLCQLTIAQNIDSLLCEIHKSDQEVRNELIKIYQNPTDNQESILLAVDKMHKVDSVNQKLVSDLLDTEGWPDSLSNKANQALFLVVDHAPLEFQKKYFSLFEKKMEEGVISKGSFATLHDRMLMRENKKQIYGTQTMGLKTQTGEEITYMWPIENPEKVDSLRASIGYPPLDEYIKQVEETYNTKVVWDKSLRVEDILQRHNIKP